MLQGRSCSSSKEAGTCQEDLSPAFEAILVKRKVKGVLKLDQKLQSELMDASVCEGNVALLRLNAIHIQPCSELFEQLRLVVSHTLETVKLPISDEATSDERSWGVDVGLKRLEAQVETSKEHALVLSLNTLTGRYMSTMGPLDFPGYVSCCLLFHSSNHSSNICSHQHFYNSNIGNKNINTIITTTLAT